MTKSSLFQIDGQPLFAPDADMSFSFQDLDSSDSGRDESGVMHRIVVRRRMGTWSFSYSHVTDAEYAYLTGLMDGKDYFAFTHPKRGSSTETETDNCYCSKDSITWHSARDGKWHNYKFDIIQC